MDTTARTPEQQAAWERITGDASTVAAQQHKAANTCEDMRRLDAIFDTDPASPLHHDNRCDAHRVTVPAPVTERVLRPCYCDYAFHPKGC